MKENKSSAYFFLVVLLVGFIFFRSGFAKIISADFPQELSSIINLFAKDNPYPYVKYFLLNIVKPNSYIFGYLVMYGELLSGLSLILGAVYNLLNKPFNRIVYLIFISGLCGATFLNLNFWLSSGWMSPSSKNLNMLMFIISILGLLRVFSEMYKGNKFEQKKE